MSDKVLEVIKYLDSLKQYFLGDISEFERIADEKELNELSNIPDFNHGSMFHPGLYDEYHQGLKVEGNEFRFRMTIPILLSLFSVIDLIGLLIKDDNESKTTMKNFERFFKRSKIYISPSNVEVLNFIFRQGVSHVYFPKLNLGVKYHSTNPRNKLFFKSTNGIIFLNVNQLLVIVKSTFLELLEDKNIQTTMEKNYKQLINEYNEKDLDKISSIEI